MILSSLFGNGSLREQFEQDSNKQKDLLSKVCREQTIKEVYEEKLPVIGRFHHCQLSQMDPQERRPSGL